MACTPRRHGIAGGPSPLAAPESAVRGGGDQVRAAQELDVRHGTLGARDNRQRVRCGGGGGTRKRAQAWE